MLFRETYYLIRVFFHWFLNSKKKKRIQLLLLKNILETASDLKTYDYFECKYDFPIECLSKLKIIDKETLSKKSRFITLDKRKINLIRYTSGTTNNPLEIIFNEESIDYLNCIFSRSLIFQGYNPFNKIGFYWYRKETNSYFNKLGLSRKVYINHNDSSEAILRKIILNKLKYIYIFPFKLLEFSGSLSDKEAKKLKLKAIFTVGEILSPKMKQLFEEKFDCSVTDNYASSEFNIIAFQKPFKKEYINNFDNTYLEFLKNKNFSYENKELYNPVITCFSNHLMPILRYKMNDLVSLNEKKNITRVFGKEDYFLKLNNSPIYLGDLIDELLNFRKKIIIFDFVLYKKDQLFVIRMKVNNSFQNEDKKEILYKIKNKFKIKKLKLRIKKNLKFLKRGKLKLINIKD